jgi:predicted nucleic acid-binding protein
MIVADTNILSTFARIKRLELLFAVAETDALHLAPAVINEIQVGINKGLDFLQPIVEGLASGAKFYSVALTSDEKSLVDVLPNSLNTGERESIAICSQRAGSKLLTNDKRAMNYCRENSLTRPQAHSPPALESRSLRQRRGSFAMEEIEKNEPGMVIKGKDEILR